MRLAPSPLQRASGASALVRPRVPPVARVRSFREHLEAQGTRDRCRLDQTHADEIAEAKARTAAVANQGVLGLHEAEIFTPERRCRNEARGAGFAERYEEPGARDAVDARVEDGADLVGKMRGDEAVDRVALSRHGAP